MNLDKKFQIIKMLINILKNYDENVTQIEQCSHYVAHVWVEKSCKLNVSHMSVMAFKKIFHRHLLSPPYKFIT